MGNLELDLVLLDSGLLRQFVLLNFLITSVCVCVCFYPDIILLMLCDSQELCFVIIIESSVTWVVCFADTSAIFSLMLV